MRLFYRSCLVLLLAFVGFDFSALMAQSRLIPQFQNPNARITLSSGKQLGEDEALLRLYAERFQYSLDEGATILFDIDENGLPVFLELHETRSGRVVRADRVYPMGAAGLRLTGRGEVVGVFDGGKVQLDHPEFQGRVTQRDNVTSIDNHATHVSGIIAAAGLNPNARGIAYEALIDAYSFSGWNNKIIQAARNEVPISNHSYGTVAGWRRDNDYQYTWRWFGDTTVNQDIDWKFGFYNTTSSFHDEFVYVYPYHLFVTSAGNSRSQRGPTVAPFEHEINVSGQGWVRSTRRRSENGPYDSTPPSGTAKNILTVGAASATNPGAFSIASFSSWGPTDDGRIKPDIMGIGVNVFSTYIDSEMQRGRYGNMSGTSMSSPNVAGGMALIRQHFIQSWDYLPLASTLKALAIHAAQQHPELPTGPDFRTGWGMLDVERAVNQISRLDSISYLIEEIVMQSGDTIRRSLLSDGKVPLEATIVWTDLPGSPPDRSLNPKDTMLVNDLDIVLIDPEGVLHYPFILDASEPTKAPERGVNWLDNVEKVFIEEPIEGEYQIRITHKKESLSNEEQIFSLIAHGASLDNSFASLFWIGGSEGSWHDADNWSDNPDGESIGRIPGPRDIVRFENHASLTRNNKISLEADAVCLNLFFNADSTTILDLNRFKLNVDGSLYANTSLEEIKNGELLFTGNALRFNGLNVPSSLNEVRLSFEATQAAIWEVESDLIADKLHVRRGLINLSNRRMTIKEIVIEEEGTGSINLEGATLSGLQLFEVPLSSAGRLQSKDMRLILDQNDALIHLADTRIGSIQVLAENVQIRGAISMDSLVVAADLSISGELSSDYLELAAGTTLSWMEETSLQANTLMLESRADAPLHLVGQESSPGQLIIQDISKQCFDYVTVSNVLATGQASLNAGPNGWLAGATDGWFQRDCALVPFADFNFVNNCFGSATEFLSASTGDLSFFQWEILDTEGNLLASFEDVTQVSFDFPGKGTFRVIHIVEDVEGNRRQATRLVEIIANGMGEMLLFEDVLGLAASIPNLSYRWFKDGVEIPGATERFFNPTESGRYAVEGSNGTCSVTSEEFEFVQSVVGLESSQVPFSFVLYPNPSGNQSRVSWHDAYRGKVTVNIYSSDAKILLSQSFDKDEDYIVCPLNLEHLSQGLFYLELSAGSKSVGMKKMIRQ